MANEIISYLEMCQREGTSLQRGMNFRLHGDHSVILMSVHPSAPYRDRIEDDGATLIYEGHDMPRSRDVSDPKMVDQPEETVSGRLTENGKFYRAARQHKLFGALPERVRVYEKLRQGIWSYNGLFHLVDSWREQDGYRMVFKYKLVAVEDDSVPEEERISDAEHTRIIPSNVKLEAWQRDKGKCVICGATDNLHFDHIIPYSKRGYISQGGEHSTAVYAPQLEEKRQNRMSFFGGCVAVAYSICALSFILVDPARQIAFARLRASRIAVVVTHGRFQLYRRFGFDVFTHHCSIFVVPERIIDRFECIC